MSANGDIPPTVVVTEVDVRGRNDADMKDDVVAGEVPVAMTYNGISHAVMMASPADLEDFALGFSITEGILRHPGELYDLDLISRTDGIAIDMRISAERFADLRQQRRNMTGRTGCGLCGTESLDKAIRPIPRLSHRSAISDDAIQQALAGLREHQPLQAQTGATHGAAWCSVEGRILDVREDVGRHNALDKLIGARLKTGADASTAFAEGFALISSRASFEMVQKSATVGIGCLVAVSAPTALAISEARKAGQRLVGFARPGRHVIYTTGSEPVQTHSEQEITV
ncbi:MAG: formate dehydrogenase accessory sulfurtransferase FdhD [Marinobacter sp.]|nr:formate dehydrogenase accessory sulfurtransferase FdhD [Marinobacter sp.]